MHFANLIKTNTTTRQILVPQGQVDYAGITKARTFIYFLRKNNYIALAGRYGEWLEFGPRNVAPINGATPQVSDDVIAVVPYYSESSVKQQPGRYWIRNTIENIAIFNDVYLRASDRWLEEHQQAHEALKQWLHDKIDTAGV